MWARAIFKRPTIREVFIAELPDNHLKAIKGGLTSVDVASSNYSLTKGYSSLHNHPDWYRLFNRNYFEPSPSDQNVAFKYKQFGGILSQKGLTIYRGIDIESTLPNYKEKLALSRFLLYAGSMPLFGSYLVDGTFSSTLMFTGFGIMAIAAAINNAVATPIKKHVAQLIQAYGSNNFIVIPWNELEQSYSPDTSIFDIVRNKTREFFPDYYYSIMNGNDVDRDKK